MTLTDNTKQHEELHRRYLELQMKQAQAAQNSYGTSTVSLGAFSHTPYLAQQTSTQIDIPKYNLSEGAWDVPVSQLVDLWTVRYGSKWVKDEELDEFYKITTQRLRPLNKLESHYVNGHDVYRIVE